MVDHASINPAINIHYISTPSVFQNEIRLSREIKTVSSNEEKPSTIDMSQRRRPKAGRGTTGTWLVANLVSTDRHTSPTTTNTKSTKESKSKTSTTTTTTTTTSTTTTTTKTKTTTTAVVDLTILA